MPYRLRKAPKQELYWVIGEDGTHKSKNPLSKEQAEAQMRALYASMNESGSRKEIHGSGLFTDEFDEKTRNIPLFDETRQRIRNALKEKFSAIGTAIFSFKKANEKFKLIDEAVAEAKRESESEGRFMEQQKRDLKAFQKEQQDARKRSLLELESRRIQAQAQASREAREQLVREKAAIEQVNNAREREVVREAQETYDRTQQQAEYEYARQTEELNAQTSRISQVAQVARAAQAAQAAAREAENQQYSRDQQARATLAESYRRATQAAQASQSVPVASAAPDYTRATQAAARAARAADAAKAIAEEAIREAARAAEQEADRQYRKAQQARAAREARADFTPTQSRPTGSRPSQQIGYIEEFKKAEEREDAGKIFTAFEKLTDSQIKEVFGDVTGLKKRFRKLVKIIYPDKAGSQFTTNYQNMMNKLLEVYSIPSLTGSGKKKYGLMRGRGTDDITIPKDDFIKEHEKLLKILKKGKKSELTAEAKDQKKELSKVLKGGMISKSLLQEMAQSAYPGKTKLNIGDYKLVFSTPTLKFYMNNDKKIVVSIRGTKLPDADDIQADGLAIIGNLKSSERYKKDLNTLLEFQKKYPKTEYHYMGVGHSLGGAILDGFIRAGLLEHGMSYNALVEPQELGGNPRHHRIYHKDDPIYKIVGNMIPNIEVRSTSEPFWKYMLEYSLPFGLGTLFKAYDRHKIKRFKGGLII